MSLTKVTYSMIRGAPVNVLDWGAVADGGVTGGDTDNSPMFQAALNYCVANQKALYVPAGNYLLKSQVIVSPSGNNAVRIYGDGMYKTILFSSSEFTGDGLLKCQAGGPPTSVEYLSILGYPGVGAAPGSIGLNLAGNACLAQHVWIGGFSTQFLVSGTDCHCVDCWGDVSLSSGTGFVITNGGNRLTDCETFACYVGILIQGGWEAAEPDIGIQIVNCSLLHCGYSGITITNDARNVSIANTMAHSPSAAHFSRDFITIDGGTNISVDQFNGRFGGSGSSSTTGIRVTGQPTNVTITNSTIQQCNIGVTIDQPLGFVFAGNQVSNNKLGGVKMSGGGPGAVTFANNVAAFNGDATSYAAHTSFGFWLEHNAAAGQWTVSGNNAYDYTSSQYYGFYLSHNGNPYQVAFTGNASQSNGVKYSYNGAGVASIINQATNAV